jgi:hypothetical protein
MKIQEDVIAILSQSRVDGNNLYLPSVQLERKLYLDVNKCLEIIGGKWNRSSKSHVFLSDPSDLLDEMINTGEIVDAKKEFQFFETPKEIVKRMIGYADIQSKDVLLEPSAGKGAILEEFPKENEKYAVELNEDNYNYLLSNWAKKDLGDELFFADFLSPSLYTNPRFPVEFHKIIMNPPFSKQQDIKHIFQAFDILANGGRLVSIVSESPFFRENKISQEFRKFLYDNNAKVYDLDAGTFKESGTMVKTRIIVVDKA